MPRPSSLLSGTYSRVFASPSSGPPSSSLFSTWLNREGSASSSSSGPQGDLGLDHGATGERGLREPIARMHHEDSPADDTAAGQPHPPFPAPSPATTTTNNTQPSPTTTTTDDAANAALTETPERMLQRTLEYLMHATKAMAFLTLWYCFSKSHTPPPPCNLRIHHFF